MSDKLELLRDNLIAFLSKEIGEIDNDESYTLIINRSSILYCKLCIEKYIDGEETIVRVPIITSFTIPFCTECSQVLNYKLVGNEITTELNMLEKSGKLESRQDYIRILKVLEASTQEITYTFITRLMRLVLPEAPWQMFI